MRRLAAILGGALLLVWPAFLNGYPLVFTDTGAFLHQTTGPLVIWDKPHVYGPLIALFHGHVTLWGPLIAQGFVVSWLLWLVQRVLRGAARPGLHLLLCLGAAALTTAPFTIALLMPDVLAPAVVLCLALLGFAREGLSRAESAGLVALGALGIAAHLSHIPLALALVVLVGLVARRVAPVLRAALPLALGLLLVLGTNLWGHGRLALSPHGATFALARLQADGPAVAVLRARCPDRGWYLCAFLDRLPMDSDEFLWAPDSPVNRDAAGVPRFLGGALLSAEAGEIVAATLRAHPAEVAWLTARNWLRQMGLAGVDLATLEGGPGRVAAVRPRIAEAFPAWELAAYDAALQARDRLVAAVAPALPVHAPVLLLGGLAALFAWRAAARAGDRRGLGLVLAVLVGVTANALATGGLSKPHLRYQARILWLMPVVAALVLVPRRGSRSSTTLPPAGMVGPAGRAGPCPSGPDQAAWAATSAGDIRTRAS